MNIVSGMLAPASVNVENAVMVGETMLEDYEKTWPEGFQQHHLQESGDNGGIMPICKDW